MSTGQMMLVLGALALLSIIMLSANRTYTTNGKTLLYSELGITAISLSTSMIQEAQGMAFDQATDNDVVVGSPTALTAPNALGPEAGEVYHDSTHDFNDFDDFNGLHLTQTFANSGTFTISCTVVYVDTSNPSVTSATQTWHKKLTVMVTSPSMLDTIRETYIFSYFYFR